MNKPFRRLRKKSTKCMVYAGSKNGFWFMVRLGVSLTAFLIVALIRLRGGELYAYTQKQAEHFFGGARQISEAYHWSVDAIETFYASFTDIPTHD